MFRGEHFEYVVEGGADRKWPVRRSAKGLYCVYDIVACMLEKDVDRAHTFKKACSDYFPAVADVHFVRAAFGPAATKEQASKIIDFIRAAMTVPGVRKMRSVDDLVLPEPDQAAGREKRHDVVRVYGPNGRVITQVREDGYFNAFQMVGAVSKAWTLFARDDALTQTHVRAALEAKGLDWLDAVKRSSDGCVWVHPDVAVALAGWCDPEFVPRVRKYVDAADDFEAALAASEEESKAWAAIKGRTAPPTNSLKAAKDKHAALQAAATEASLRCAECWAKARQAEAEALAADKAAQQACRDALQARFDLMCASIV